MGKKRGVTATHRVSEERVIFCWGKVKNAGVKKMHHAPRRYPAGTGPGGEIIGYSPSPSQALTGRLRVTVTDDHHSDS